MNNLKFKVYNNHAKDFVSNGSEVAIFDMVSWAKYCYVNGFSDISHLRFLFFTGLINNHGKEIYEGDIVQYNQNSSYDNMNFIAKWSDDKLGFIFQSNSGDELLNQTPHLNRFKHLEVVGNIFENKKILN